MSAPIRSGLTAHGRRSLALAGVGDPAEQDRIAAHWPEILPGEREYVITFGSKYRREPHPVLRDAHPDAYVTIIAVSGGQARRAAFAWLGNAWAFPYLATDFDAEAYATRGEIDRRAARELLDETDPGSAR